MSKHPSDSFLSSGAVDTPWSTFNPRPGSGISAAAGIPRTVPEATFVPSAHSNSNSDASTSPTAIMQSRSPNGQPISPPKTRSCSADDNIAALIEDWRVYTQNLRSQHEGEKAHMIADRTRMEEVMAEERTLWDLERENLKAQIRMLEAATAREGGESAFSPPVIGYKSPPHGRNHALSIASMSSNAISVSGSVDSSSRAIAQESGRNADGTPFYAPAPRNPSRTFSSSETSELRVDSITSPRESAIRVTSKELKSSDFGVQSPLASGELELIPEIPQETIDISHIQPDLEGVQIKASAVSPTFAARVLSPDYSPSRLSPNSHSKSNRTDGSPPSGSRSRSPEEIAAEKEMKTLEIVSEPFHRRLTMHAGHTPNHSITKFEFLGGSGSGGGESGNETPRGNPATDHLHHPSLATGLDEDGSVNVDVDDEDQGDRELTGPLGLTNDSIMDDSFLAQLIPKLEEARKTSSASPSTESASGSSVSAENTSRRSSRLSDDEDDLKDDGPVLRLKPSFNFGRPMGSF
ncbi:uncharacterized protein BP5553_01472 [Venustampulla echinocandica]|uniref:Uncharacterized protein n=1 Tax=Venustampulla echinocandica TaxID=2656787 RepID=A0A370U169_9HELO|nr:uncharacterized protein BP5553_01472 [Venustampulla echinocandica]RDL41493.1 hypothetical protein BP5553_01472 [Venustampulla echinocandica]